MRPDPNEPPFWEKARGGGPITTLMRKHGDSYQRQKARELELDNLLAGEPKEPASGKAYQKRRALGLCIQCGAPSGGASRCRPCAQEHAIQRERYR